MRNEFSRFSDPNSFFTNPGDRFHIVYTPKILDDGTIDLVESGKDDIQEMIDSWRESTDMSWIIARLKEGDMSVLEQREPVYIDTTELPKTYAEALQLIIDRQRQFYELPVDVRNSFDNDFNQWFSQAGSETWLQKMDPVLPHETIVEEEVKE